MKKRVRVYKAGGESNQPTQEQIVSYISQRMSADDFDGDVDALKAELAQAGIEDSIADNYIAYVSDNLGLEDDSQSDAEMQAAAEQEQASTDEEQALLEEQQAAEDEARQQQQAAMYDTNIDMSTTEDTAEDEETYMRQGGTNLNKRSFIKKYTKFAKMAQGGDTPSPGADDILNGREAHVKGFLGAVRNTAQEAALREEAEAQYNSAYGAPQVGAFQEGGIQQEQIDTESPYDHLAKDTAARRHIFSDNMYTQNDIAALEQFGGNTGQGLYKFIGGGDNESADEEYQDADIDFNQEQYQMGGFRMPKRSGRQYTQAVGSPYYTATGQAANPVDLANRKVTSVDVTKRGIFGRPKAYTVNYDGSTSATPAINPATTPTGEYMPPNEFTGDRQPLANWMMRTGIPGVRGLGAKMIKSGSVPEAPMNENSTVPASNEPYYPPMSPRAQRRENRDDRQLNRLLGDNTFTNSNPESVNTPENQKQIDIAKKIEALAASSTNSNLSDDENTYQDFLIRHQGPAYKEYGGPIDYTQYAYGGDVSVPDLYKAQIGTEVAFDPNKNNLNEYLSFKAPEIEDNETFAPPTEDNTIKPLTPEEELLKYQRGYNQQLTYVDPKVAGESIAGIGTTDNPIKQKQGTSEDYLNKKNWDKTRKNFDTGLMAVNAGLDVFDQVTANRQQNQMLANTTAAETNYGISNEDDRGTYDPNSGLFRPDQMGSNVVVKYGGGVYATGGSTEDEDEDTQYMTQEEIDDFIANGGELEYL
jgi:hypothetical protein